MECELSITQFKSDKNAHTKKREQVTFTVFLFSTAEVENNNGYFLPFFVSLKEIEIGAKDLGS